jgi:hypothetical protein
MQKWVSSFFSELHRNHLKQLGFKKVRHTFSRDAGDYWERINFQGSAWNNSNEPWDFYINVGVEFKDLPERKYWALLPHTHWSRRIGEIVKDAPGGYEIAPNKNEVELATQIVIHIQKASATISLNIADIRSSYISKGHDR